MRLLTVNYSIPNPEIDNHSVFNALPFFDYPAIVVDPAGISRAIDDLLAGGQHLTAANQPVRDDLSTSDAVGLAELLRRRREETIRLLQRGGVVIVFAQPNILHPRVTGFTGCDRYFWLPAPEGTAYREGFLFGADGGGPVEVADESHPAAAVLNRFAKSTNYRAYFNESSSVFDDLAHVIARSPGGAVAAVEFRVLNGRVVFLPYIDSTKDRFDLGTEFLKLARTLVRRGGTEPTPPWVENYMLPGIEQGRRELEEAGLAAAHAANVRDAATENLQELERYRDLLWQEGIPLEEAARAAMAILGYRVTGEPGSPAGLDCEEYTAVLECEGSTDDVGYEAFRRLSRRVEDELVESGEGRKGILVVNPHRLQDPYTRPQGYDDRLLRAAEFQGFALIPAPRLFRLVELALTGRALPDDLRRLIGETEGEFVPATPTAATP